MDKPTVRIATIRYAQDLYDFSILNGSAEATLEMSNGSVEMFQWFHDEITYASKDFEGKTLEQIRKMHYERDMAYLKS